MTKKKSRKRLYAIVAAAAVLLILISSLLFIVASRTPTLSLSSSTVTAGDMVVANATNVPANQNGEIQLRSTLHVFPFHADANGRVSQPILVPRNIGAGDHTVTICWASRCRNSVTLHVVEPGVAFASPTPGASPSPNTSPGSSPTPTGGTSGSPPPSPISTPKSSPPPAPPPSPTPTPSPSVTIVSISSVGNTVVTFHYFYGSSTSVAVCQGTTCHSAGSVSVASGANVTVSFKTPLGILAAPLGGPAYVATGCCGHTGTVSVGA